MVNDIKGLNQHVTKGLNVANNQQTEQTENRTNQSNSNRDNLSASSPSSNVSLTDTASKLRELEAKIASQPVVDTQRVESIKKAIADGSFRVNASRTAEKMAAFESLLASKAGDR